MENNSIGVYARMKPAISKASDYRISKSNSSDIITFKRVVGGNRNKPTSYSFKFNKIFESFTNQSEIFTLIAKPVVDRVLQGYNGTIMAYGQTGSGKTYTIIGGQKTYDDRGIVPRTLQYLYSTFQNAEALYTVHISYLEIYNESGYDLLSRKTNLTNLEDFPRVIVLEDTNQKCHIRNLHLQPASDEAEALDLLFLGDTNRVIAETPVNPCSSRSHCVFTIHLTARVPGNTKVRRSKLHLVDLAGSERASKVGLNGVTLREAKSINRSLHFLERVTAALADSSSNSSASHVPYRNSLLTNILRDSLGGNCLTTFVITLSTDVSFLPETLSSCRFSQRAALIKNVPVPNEEPDLVQEAALLRDEVERLREKLARLAAKNQLDDPKIGQQREDSDLDWNERKNGTCNEELSHEIIEECKRKVEKFISDTVENELDVGTDPCCIRLCFQIFKKYLQEEKNRHKFEKSSDDSTEILLYKEQIKEKDKEIATLINLLQSEKLHSMKNISCDKVSPMNNDNCKNPQPATPLKSSTTINESQESYQHSLPKDTSDEEQLAFKEFTELGGIGASLKKEIEERNQILQDKYNNAKQITRELQARRETIISLCQQLNKMKESIGAWNLIDSRLGVQDTRKLLIKEDGVASPICSTEVIETAFIKEQEAYKYTLTKLEQLKHEINHLNHTLKNAEIQLNLQFKFYWERIQSCSSARNPTPLPMERSSSNSSITADAKNMCLLPQNANLIQSPNQGFDSNFTLNRQVSTSSNDVDPPSTMPMQSTLYYMPIPNATSYMQTNPPPCYIQTSNPHNYMSKPYHVPTSNCLCYVPAPNCMTPQNKSDVSALNPTCYDKFSDQRFNNYGYKNAHAKSRIITAQKPEMRQTFDFIQDQLPENKNNDEFPEASSSSTIIPNALCTQNGELIQASGGKIYPGDHRALNLTSDFHTNSENIRCIIPQTSHGNNHMSSVSFNSKDDYSYNNLPLTGDKEVDEEILAFYKARNRVLNKNNHQTN